MIRKLFGKTAFAAFAAALFCGSARAATHDCGDIYLSLGKTVVLSNEVGTAGIPWADVQEASCTSDDTDIAKIVSTDVSGTVYAAVMNPKRDGEANVKLVTTGGDEYVYRVQAITVSIEKTVRGAADPDDHSNATVRIVTHVLNNRKPTPPNVLFVGTRCSSHELSDMTISNTLNGIASVANLDWYLLGDISKDKGTGVVDTKGYVDCGSVAKGGTAKVTAKVESSHHRALLSFYNLLENEIMVDAGKSNKYDYVVIEIDGSRLALDNKTEFTAARVRKVAEFMKRFYDNDRVIWVVDNGEDFANYFDRNNKTYIDIYPYGDYKELNDYYADNGTSSAEHKYRVANLFLRHDSGPKNFHVVLVDDSAGQMCWRALLGLMDPSLCLQALDGGNDYSDIKSDTEVMLSNTSTAKTKVTLKAGLCNPHQLYYNDAATIGTQIKAMIRPVEYTAELADRIIEVQDSLNVVGTRLYGLKPGERPTTEILADDGKWDEIRPSTIVLDGHAVSNTVANITTECWQKVEIDIRIASDFVKKALEKKQRIWEDEGRVWNGISWNEAEGRYEVNPNEGEAMVTLWSGEGASRVKCTATAAATADLWNLPPQTKQFDLASDDAVKTYDGIQTNIFIEVKDPPADAKISYRNVGDTEWTTFTPGAPYVNVSDSTNVEFKVEAEGYDTFYGTNKVTIAPSPIKPYNPDRPGKPETPLGPDDPEPPTPPAADGPFGWGRSVVREYDGRGTNIVVKAANVTGGYAVRYALAKAGPYVDDLQFTNVTYGADGKVGPTNVYFEVSGTVAGNYIALTNSATVTITPKDQTKGPDEAKNGVFANDLTMTYGGAVPEKTYRVGEGFLPGDGVRTVQLVFTNGTDVTQLPKGEYPNLISTNDAVKVAITVTNATGDVTGNYRLRFTPGRLTVESVSPQLSGSMRVKYAQQEDAFFVGLDVTCTNGDPTAVRELAFLYEDRADGYYLRVTNGDTRLSQVCAYTNGQGTVFAKAVFDDAWVEDNIRRKPLNTTGRYGVTNAFTAFPDANIVPKAERKICLVVTNGIRKLAVLKDAESLAKTLGYLSWMETGGEVVHTSPLSATPEVARLFGSASLPPLSLSQVNRSLALGLPAVTADSDPTLCIEAFDIGESEISGRVATSDGERKGVPGGNARITVLGAATLGGAFVEVARPALSAQGEFSFAKPSGIAFFRVKLEVVDVVR